MENRGSSLTSMEQDMMIQPQMVSTETAPQQGSYQSMDFVQLKTVPYTATGPPVQGYTSAQLLTLTNPGHTQPCVGDTVLDQTGCSVLSTHGGFVTGTVVNPGTSHLTVGVGDLTGDSLCGDKSVHRPTVTLPSGQSVGASVDIAVDSVHIPRSDVSSSWGDIDGSNGTSVAGSSITESAVVSLESSMNDGVTVGSSVNQAGPIAGSDQVNFPLTTPGITMKNLPTTNSASGSGDGLCNIQLLTYSCADGAPSIKLVTVTDAILISVQFKCRICEKAFSSPDALTSHSKCHLSEEQEQGPQNQLSGVTAGSVDKCPVRMEIKRLVDGMAAEAQRPASENTAQTNSSDDLEYVEMEESVENELVDSSSSVPGKQRVCFLCKKSFAAHDLWKHYLDSHMLDNESRCFVCGKKLDNDRELLKHMMNFHTGFKDETLFRCAVCDKKFNAKPLLLNHMIQMHPSNEEPHSAHKTASKSPSKQNNSNEKQSKQACGYCEGTGVVSSKKHPCRICSKLFSDSRQLQKHMSGHNEQTLCTVCHKVVFLKSLPKHMMLHTKPKSWKCNQCDRAYRDKCDLRKHMRIHTGEKPYTCEICNKSFAHSSQLPRHLRTHSGEKPYECLVCHKVFSRKFGLQQHMTRHAEDKPFKCSDCGKEFRDRKGLKKHKLKHSPTGQQQQKGPECNPVMDS